MTTHDFTRLVEDLLARREARKLIARAKPEQILRLLEDIQALPDAGYQRG
ncbi:MAG: hypothetical protein AAGI09_15515 [Pseudomonadota bacterium]